MTVKQYLHNKAMHTLSLFRYSNGRGVYVIKGQEFTPEELAKHFPIHALKVQPARLNGAGADIDGRRKWMHETK